MLDMLINVDRMQDDSTALALGLSIARSQGAHVTGLHVAAVYPPVMGVPEMVALLQDEERQALARAPWWQDLCKRHEVEGDWEVIRGIYVPVLAKRSRLADFVVTEVPVDAPDAPIGFDHITRTLFAGSSPMLLVPDHWPSQAPPQCVLVAWNGSGEAIRAIRAALPLMRTAKAVHVLDGERDELPGLIAPPLPLRAWFQRQGVDVQWHPFDIDDPGKGLLDQARTLQADLLVMGAWGRSRLSELMLGGATRHVLEYADLPVLLSH